MAVHRRPRHAGRIPDKGRPPEPGRNGNKPYCPESGSNVRPAGFGLPPMIDSTGIFQQVRQPRWRSADRNARRPGRALPASTGRAGPGISRRGPAAFDCRSHRCGRSEQHFHLVLRTDPPECTGIRRSYRLALIHDAGAAAQAAAHKRCSCGHNDPADIRGRPIDVADIATVNRRCMEFHSATAWPPLSRTTPLGPARGSGGVQNIQRIGGQHGHAISRCGGCLGRQQIVVAARFQGSNRLLSLQNEAGIGLVRRQFDRVIQQRFVLDHPARFQPAGGRHDHLRPGIGDARVASSAAAKPPNTTE